MHISQKMIKVWPARNKMNFLDLAQKLISISNPHQHFDVSRDGTFPPTIPGWEFFTNYHWFHFYPTRWEFFPWHTKNRWSHFCHKFLGETHWDDDTMALRWDLLRRLLFPDLAWLGLTSSLLCVYNVRGAQGERPQERLGPKSLVGFIVEIEVLVGLVWLVWDGYFQLKFTTNTSALIKNTRHL